MENQAPPTGPIGPSPTLGRVVHYRFRAENTASSVRDPDVPGPVVVRPAIVVALYDGAGDDPTLAGCVELLVHLAYSDTHEHHGTQHRRAVEQVQHGAEGDVGVWFWPPRVS